MMPGRRHSSRLRKVLAQDLPEDDFGMVSTNATWRIFSVRRHMIGDECHDLLLP
jgi:hypothetical protein